jgi:hypothetical protein
MATTLAGSPGSGGLVPSPSPPAPFSTRPFRSCPDAPIDVWFADPACFVTHLSGPCLLDVRAVEFMARVHAEGARAFAFRPGTRFRFVHAWSNLRAYEGRARQRLVEWGARMKSTLESVDLLLPGDAPVLLRMGAKVVEASFATMGVPVRTRFTSDPRPVVEELGLDARWSRRW